MGMAVILPKSMGLFPLRPLMLKMYAVLQNYTPNSLFGKNNSAVLTHLSLCKPCYLSQSVRILLDFGKSFASHVSPMLNCFIGYLVDSLHPHAFSGAVSGRCRALQPTSLLKWINKPLRSINCRGKRGALMMSLH